MKAAITLFKRVATFGIPICLIFTKFDVLEAHWEIHPFLDFFPDFLGPSTPDFFPDFRSPLTPHSIYTYFTNLFRGLHSTAVSMLYTFCVNAADPDQFEMCFKDISVYLRSSLHGPKPPPISMAELYSIAHDEGNHHENNNGRNPVSGYHDPTAPAESTEIGVAS